VARGRCQAVKAHLLIPPLLNLRSRADRTLAPRSQLQNEVRATEVYRGLPEAPTLLAQIH